MPVTCHTEATPTLHHAATCPPPRPAGIVKISPQYAQQHQLAVVDCLEDPDDTLKLKTLELLYRMTKANNVEVIVGRMMAYLAGASDEHIRRDIVRKLCELAERYAPDTRWFLATMVQVRLGACGRECGCGDGLVARASRLRRDGCAPQPPAAVLLRCWRTLQWPFLSGPSVQHHIWPCSAVHSRSMVKSQHTQQASCTTPVVSSPTSQLLPAACCLLAAAHSPAAPPQVFELGGEHVEPSLAHNLMRLVAEQDGGLQASAVAIFSELLHRHKLPDILLQTATWVLGEYGAAAGQAQQVRGRPGRGAGCWCSACTAGGWLERHEALCCGARSA
jgi:hypothetical protein